MRMLPPTVSLVLALAPQTLIGGEAPRVCDEPVHAAFDFWLGTWLVHSSDSGALKGVDRIERDASGCFLTQSWLALDDAYRPEGAASRLVGRSLLYVDPMGVWHQTWVDNSGFAVTLAATSVAAGQIVMISEAVHYPGGDGGSVPVVFRWHWERQEDGSVRSHGYRRVGAGAQWRRSFDNRYLPNR